jgi:hypothetical protein
MRRRARFDAVLNAEGAVHVRGQLTTLDTELPGLRLRVHMPHVLDSTELVAPGPDRGFVEAAFADKIDLRFNL